MNEELGAGDRKHEGLSAEAEAHLSRAEALYSALLGDRARGIDTQDELVEISQSLKAKYPNWQKCAMMHVIAGSGMFEPPVIVDFEGKDSILSLLEDLARRMNVKV